MSLIEPRAITVAELIRRSAPASDLDHNCAEPIPVSALLQRERRRTGDASRWPDRPRAPEPIAWPTNHGLLVRRAAIAAGALLAAGCVFGLTAALHHTAEQPTVSGTFAGQEVPEGTAAEAPTLDGGSAAPVSWVAAALPTTLKSSTIAQPIAAAATGSTSAHATAVRPAAGGTTEGRTSTSTSSAAASTTHHSGGAAATTGARGDTASGVGANPAANTDGAGVTRAVGTTVPHVSRTHTKTTAPLTTTTTSSPPTTTTAAPTTDPSTTTVPTTTTDPPTTDPPTTDPSTTTTDPSTTTTDPPTTARLTSSAPTSESTAPTTSGVAKTEGATATP